MKNIKSAQRWKFFFVVFGFLWLHLGAMHGNSPGLAFQGPGTQFQLCHYFVNLHLLWPLVNWLKSFCKITLGSKHRRRKQKFSRILFPSPFQTVSTKGKQEGTGETKGKRNRRERKIQVACSCGPPTSGASSWDRITSNLPHPSRDFPFVLKFRLHFAHPYPSRPTPSYLRSLAYICLF